MFATNCWVIAASEGSECLIVDPGMPDISAEVSMMIEEHKLKPVAALLTHAHLDHTFSVKPLADGYGIPTYIHSEDRRFVANPEGLHGEQFNDQLRGMTFAEPNDVRELRNEQLLDLLGMKVKAISGDVLFAGSIGRTDLPTGSHKEMVETLRKKVLPLDDSIRVLTGHGPETTIKFERKNNPYLKELTS
jgi:glyoxylase-like metal-dependent hydrolase (beta-lactamase superfamily II)